MFINELCMISILLLIIISENQVHSLIFQSFFWNRTTFRSYQDHSLMFEVRLGDVMDLICPFYDIEKSHTTHEFEQYDIYRVTENEYDRCTVDPFDFDSTTRLLITCNSPFDIMKYTLNFRSYLPIPNGLEFHPNRTYYFISTSTIDRGCFKLKIFVHDYHRVSLLSSTVSSRFELENKTHSYFHYSHHRHGPSSSNKHIDYNDSHRLFSHLIKAQRHSNPHSIKWITEGPNEVKNFDKSHRTMNKLDITTAPPNAFSLALSSSSSKLSTSLMIIFILHFLK